MSDNIPNELYFTMEESSQFAFYRVPKDLVHNTSGRWDGVSLAAKMLYGLFLDRMELSRKNDWRDIEGRVYIIYTIPQICEALSVSRPTAVTLIDELVKVKLITKRVSKGAATLLYPLKFVDMPKNTEEPSELTSAGVNAPHHPPVKNFNYPPLEDSAEPVKKFNYPPLEEPAEPVKNFNYPQLKNLTTPVKNFNPSNTDSNKTENSETEKTFVTDRQSRARENGRSEIRAEFEEKLGAPLLRATIGDKLVDELLNLLEDVMTTTVPTMRLCKRDVPTEQVRERMRLLRSEHITHIVSNIRQNAEPIRNSYAYLLSALYRATSETVFKEDASEAYDARQTRENEPTRLQSADEIIEDVKRYQQMFPNISANNA